jgi:hypothetical protein
MMINQIEKALCLSGNSQRLDVPAHMDAAVNPVENESLAVGYPVTIETICRDNVFFMDETGDNTHGKKDGRRGVRSLTLEKVREQIILSAPTTVISQSSQSQI